MRPIFWNAWAFIACVAAILFAFTGLMSAVMAADEGDSRRFAIVMFAIAGVVAAAFPFLLELAERAA